MRRLLRGLLVMLIVLVALVAAVVTVVTLALPNPVPPSDPRPARDYREAKARLADLEARDTAEVGWGTIAHLQGSQVATAVVLFHGYTNNPKQYEWMAEDYHRAGYNVVAPRLPGHGMKDLMTTALSDVDAAKLVSATDEAIDIAAGLGKNVEVVGLSGGGTLAAWAARNRSEVTDVVLISPLFTPKVAPVFVAKPITQLSRVWPEDIYMWWDPRAKEKRDVPPQGYPRFSIDSLSAFLEVGYAVSDQDPKRQGKLRRAVLMTNAADDSVNEGYAKKVFKDRVAPLADEIMSYEFPADKGYAHDLIDPQGENADHIVEIYEVLYPILGLPPPPESEQS